MNPIEKISALIERLRREALFVRLRRDAVLLHRPYPPHLATGGTSKFGGLPNLPADTAWPRMKRGTPLHFLVQIDCAALPFASRLPNKGMLFFFALDDDEQLWDEKSLGEEGSCVVYAPYASGTDPVRATPSDLLPIRYPFSPSYQEPFLLEGELGSNQHVEWPIELRRMDSWPDASALTDEDLGLESMDFSTYWELSRLNDPRARIWAEDNERLRGAYKTELNARRLAAYRAASAYTLDDAEIFQEDYSSSKIAWHIFQQLGPMGWPDYWPTIGYFARALRKKWQSWNKNLPPEKRDTRIDGALDWIVMADAKAPTEAVPKAQKDAFLSWAFGTPIGQEISWKDFLTADDFFFEAMIATVRQFAKSPDMARLIAPEQYAGLASCFQGIWHDEVMFSQMLGHAPSAQEARSTGDPTICLLSLPSDRGLGWTFGDAGWATYWIDRKDLIQRNFDKAWAEAEGH
jgi:hypothetical protein